MPDVRYPIFLALLEYLYTDQVAIDLDIAMELFQVHQLSPLHTRTLSEYSVAAGPSSHWAPLNLEVFGCEQAADRYGVERLKKMCESKMLASISIDNAASIFHAADVYNAVRPSLCMRLSCACSD
jgi:hypothetical protein